MITRWTGGIYGEADRGNFEAWLLRYDTAIAYTDGDEVRLTEEYRVSDREAVLEFAEQYELQVEQ